MPSTNVFVGGETKSAKAVATAITAV
jgi:hypothetical protein